MSGYVVLYRTGRNSTYAAGPFGSEATADRVAQRLRESIEVRDVEVVETHPWRDVKRFYGAT